MPVASGSTWITCSTIQAKTTRGSNRPPASEGSPYRDRYIFSEDPQADIAAGRIDQIATEGAAGYDAGQWFSTDTGAGAAGRFKFVLDWTNADSPTVTVTETTDAADADNTQGGPDDKYLYFGNGTSKRFYARGGNSYELTLDFDSDWGFLVRTSTTSWAAGTKYGAPDNRTIIRFGEPFTLMSNRSADPANVQFSLPTMYHSHFWTAAFADLNYGKAAEAEQSRAFKAVAEAADKWVRMGVDGFRLDAVKHIYHNAYNDENPTFLKKFYDRMNETYKAAGGEGDFYMVGEMLDEADKAAPYYRGLPALFEFTFWYKLKWALQNGIGCYFVKDILDVQPLYAQYRSDYIEATKLSNHDEDRTGSDLGQSVEKMKVAAAVLLTAQGAPYIYQGEELGYWGTKSNGDEYVRTPILWDKAGNELASGSLSGKSRHADADRSNLGRGAGRRRRFAAQPLPHVRPAAQHLSRAGAGQDGQTPGLQRRQHLAAIHRGLVPRTGRRTDARRAQLRPGDTDTDPYRPTGQGRRRLR